ncbi:MAG: hypothetical protein WKF89_09835 [Chitinophagaceae bacterium]
MPVKENAKYGFSNGVYTIVSPKGTQRVYVQLKANQLQANNIKRNDTIGPVVFEELLLQGDSGVINTSVYKFSKPSFDIDFLSIPLKFRPAVSTLPNQLTSNINGAVYIGRREDVYFLKRKNDLFGGFSSSIDHYGFSFGIFTGLGSTAINPWVTNNAINMEYDGAVVPIGITGLFAVNNIAFGIASGIDHLLSKDRNVWIYKGKPWIGLSVALNLN